MEDSKNTWSAASTILKVVLLCVAINPIVSLGTTFEITSQMLACATQITHGGTELPETSYDVYARTQIHPHKDGNGFSLYHIEYSGDAVTEVNPLSGWFPHPLGGFEVCEVSPDRRITRRYYSPTGPTRTLHLSEVEKRKLQERKALAPLLNAFEIGVSNYNLAMHFESQYRKYVSNELGDSFALQWAFAHSLRAPAIAAEFASRNGASEAQMRLYLRTGETESAPTVHHANDLHFNVLIESYRYLRRHGAGAQVEKLAETLMQILFPKTDEPQ